MQFKPQNKFCHKNSLVSNPRAVPTFKVKQIKTVVE